MTKVEETVFATASTALEFLVFKMNEQLGYPVVHDPKLDYQGCVEEYRTHYKDRYKGQGRRPHPDDLTPTLIGWDRNAARFQQSTGVGGRRNSVTECICPEVDANGDMTGNAIVWRGLLAELPLRFRIYSTDIRVIEKLEILYLSQMGISNIKEIPVYVNPLYFLDHREKALVTEQPAAGEICKASKFMLDWDFTTTNLSFTRDESYYATYEFECIMRGEFLYGTGTPETVNTDPEGNYNIGKSTYVMDIRYQAKMVEDVDAVSR